MSSGTASTHKTSGWPDLGLDRQGSSVSPTSSAQPPSSTRTTRSTDPTTGSANRSIGRPRADPLHATPSNLADPNCFNAALLGSAPDQRAAGVGNHWFYLLAEGTNPTNGQPASPTCNGTKLTGVGMEQALKVLYHAMLMKTTSSSYPKYRTWTLEPPEADRPVVQPLRQGQGGMGRRHRAGPAPGRDLHAARCRGGGPPPDSRSGRAGSRVSSLTRPPPAAPRRHLVRHSASHSASPSAAAPAPSPVRRPRGRLRRDGDSDGPRRLERQLVVQIRDRCGRVLGDGSAIPGSRPARPRRGRPRPP